MKKILVEITGIVPLLMHRFAEESAEDAVKINTGGGVDYSKETVKSLYLLDDKKTLYQPSTHIEGAMLKASSNYKIVGRGKKTYKDLVKSAVLVSPDAIVHKNQNWTVDKRAVIIGRARIMRERPKLTEWGLEFELHLLDDQLKVEVVNQILIYAGQYVGIGDYRPKFGRFIVSKFEEVKV